MRDHVIVGVIVVVQENDVVRRLALGAFLQPRLGQGRECHRFAHGSSSASIDAAKTDHRQIVRRFAAGSMVHDGLKQQFAKDRGVTGPDAS